MNTKLAQAPKKVKMVNARPRLRRNQVAMIAKAGSYYTAAVTTPIAAITR
jgi:hypothetical protein